MPLSPLTMPPFLPASVHYLRCIYRHTHPLFPTLSLSSLFLYPHSFPISSFSPSFSLYFSLFTPPSTSPPQSPSFASPGRHFPSQWDVCICMSRMSSPGINMCSLPAHAIPSLSPYFFRHPSLLPLSLPPSFPLLPPCLLPPSLQKIRQLHLMHYLHPPFLSHSGPQTRRR